MPSHLHPRSRLTTSLFGTTLLISFLIVGMPHILPCPAPRIAFADAEISEDDRRRRRRRRRRRLKAISTESEEDLDECLGEVDDEKTSMGNRAHECPVPKPSGRFGKVLGFAQAKTTKNNESSCRFQIEARDSER